MELVSMCLLLPWQMGFLTKLIADLLSIFSLTGTSSHILSSIIDDCSQFAWQSANDTVTCSASLLVRAITDSWNTKRYVHLEAWISDPHRLLLSTKRYVHWYVDLQISSYIGETLITLNCQFPLRTRNTKVIGLKNLLNLQCIVIIIFSN